jgi:D-glycero-D-manno-heptose 1,7-bisphosphate phosphatase
MNDSNQKPTHPTKQKAVFLDRDGVVNRLEMGDYVTSWDKFEFLEGVIPAITELNNAGFLVIIITNQSAVNRGLMSTQDLVEIHMRMLTEMEKKGASVDAIYYCPHAPDEGCDCRKPKAGMFNQVNGDFEIDYPNSWFVGDFESDREVAQRMGLKFIMAKGDNGLKNALGQILG